jgi:hypothetical protein
VVALAEDGSRAVVGNVGGGGSSLWVLDIHGGTPAVELHSELLGHPPALPSCNAATLLLPYVCTLLLQPYVHAFKHVQALNLHTSVLVASVTYAAIPLLTWRDGPACACLGACCARMPPNGLHPYVNTCQ